MLLCFCFLEHYSLGLAFASSLAHLSHYQPTGVDSLNTNHIIKSQKKEIGERMPFTVQQLIEGRQEPITVSPQDTVQRALALMTEYDFSQLPVVDEKKKPLGL